MKKLILLIALVALFAGAQGSRPLGYYPPGISLPTYKYVIAESTDIKLPIKTELCWDGERKFYTNGKWEFGSISLPPPPPTTNIVQVGYMTVTNVIRSESRPGRRSFSGLFSNDKMVYKQIKQDGRIITCSDGTNTVTLVKVDLPPPVEKPKD